MPDEDVPGATPDVTEPQAASPPVELNTDNSQNSTPELSAAPSAATEPVFQVPEIVRPKDDYEAIAAENARLRAAYDAAIQAGRPSEMRTRDELPEPEIDEAWKPYLDVTERRVAKQIEPIRNAIEEMRAERQALALDSATDRLASQVGSAVDRWNAAQPTIKDEPELAADIKARVDEAVRAEYRSTGGRPIAPERVWAFYEKQLGLIHKAYTKGQMRSSKVTSDRAKGAKVPSIGGGSTPAPAPSKPNKINYDKGDDRDALIAALSKRGY